MSKLSFVMKHIIILGDGMADHPIASLGGKTLLQAACTPNMDRLARLGRNGRLLTVLPGFHPGSEVANMSVLGYDLPKVYEGRGPLEAASIGVDLQPGDMAMRCNLVCIEGDILKNHSAGHITTEEADVLIKYLQEQLGNDRIHFYTGVQYRHLLVVKGGNKHLDCTPPHDVPLQPFRPLLVKAEAGHPEAEDTAALLNDLILRSQELLARHPLNLHRVSEGKDHANSIWPWSPGYRPQMELFSSRFPEVKRGAVITAVDLIRGIGRYAGLRRIDVEGATGLYDTNYENKVRAALDALRTDDFVYLHIEAWKTWTAALSVPSGRRCSRGTSLWPSPSCPIIPRLARCAPTRPSRCLSSSGIPASSPTTCRPLTRWPPARAATACCARMGLSTDS